MHCSNVRCTCYKYHHVLILLYNEYPPTVLRVEIHMNPTQIINPLRPIHAPTAIKKA